MNKFKQWFKDFFSQRDPSCSHHCVEKGCRQLTGMTVCEGCPSFITIVHTCYCDKCGADLSWNENIDYCDE